MFVNRRGFMATAGVSLVCLGAGGALPLFSREDQPSKPSSKQRARLKGIDVSNYQGKIDWHAVKKSGVVFAFAKATEGVNFVDKTFAANFKAMKAAGIIRGAYHFGHPNRDAVAQARHFHKVVKPQKGDLHLMLDLEANDGKKPAEVLAWTKAFLSEIKRLSGRSSILYTSPSFWQEKVGDPKQNFDAALFIAHYGVKEPRVPRAWTTWTFWQYTPKGKTPGIKGNCDLDFFNGHLDQLKKLTF